MTEEILGDRHDGVCIYRLSDGTIDEVMAYVDGEARLEIAARSSRSRVDCRGELNV